VEFDDTTVSVGLQYLTLASESDDYEYIYPLISISCRGPDWQLSSVAQVCNSSLPLLSTVEDLYIVHRYSQLVWKNDGQSRTAYDWKNFTYPRNLHQVSRPPCKSSWGGSTTEVLPSLQNISVEGARPFRENIRQFDAARQLSGHPFTIFDWNEEEESAFVMYSMCFTSASNGRHDEADIVVCPQGTICRPYIGEDFFWGLVTGTRAWQGCQVRSFLSIGPQASPQRQLEEVYTRD